MLEELRDHWTVQRQQNHGFSSVACDITIEQTLNRDSKSKGGTKKKLIYSSPILTASLLRIHFPNVSGMVGITLNRGAMQRWILAQSDRSAITGECMKMAGTDPTKRYTMQNNFYY